MKAFSRRSGYSADTAKEYIDLKATLYSLSTSLDNKFEYVDGERTQNIIAYESWFIVEGTEPFKVKFPKKVSLPPFMSPVNLIDLEAVVVRGNVYFKASGLTEVR
ncbi:hypothetical protein ACMZ6Y_01150 [Streptococcus pluranimalium]|uniref:hypothetical protein n=1 Tax=Streptococcus hyovaginalis TaxID=149015 RepID=UPI003AD27AF8